MTRRYDGVGARMVKSADTADLKSAGHNRPWGFKSPSGHHRINGLKETILLGKTPNLLGSPPRGRFLCREGCFARNGGVFEKLPGSDIWWIRFKVDGIEHREKVGRRGDAIKLYKIRKADLLRGVKMPANMKDKGVRFSVLAQEAIELYINHERKDVRNFKGRMKFILEAFGDRVADEIKPSGIDSWLGAHASVRALPFSR